MKSITSPLRFVPKLTDIPVEVDEDEETVRDYLKSLSFCLLDFNEKH